MANTLARVSAGGGERQQVTSPQTVSAGGLRLAGLPPRGEAIKSQLNGKDSGDIPGNFLENLRIPPEDTGNSGESVDIDFGDCLASGLA